MREINEWELTGGRETKKKDHGTMAVDDAVTIYFGDDVRCETWRQEERLP